ncbi:MAG: hypothetical protein QE272_12780 [Nevskia sp.]|nr:hypothetical protein [Nevskia sp.]
MRRPLVVLLVFAVEAAFLIRFQSEVLSFASSVGNLEFFKGLGTLLFPAPIAFLLWYWRDSDKQRELQNDAVRLQNENDKLVLEKRILEGEAAVAREKIDKAHLEVQLAKMQNELDEEKAKIDQIRGRVALTDRALRELTDEDVTAVLRYLSEFFEEGLPKEGVDHAVPTSIRKMFLTQVGQFALKEWAERYALFEPYLLDVFTDAEIPEFKLPHFGSRK